MEKNEQLKLAKTSLLGLSIGDAFGETFFGREEEVLNRISNKQLQEGDWLFTDDTVMSIGIYKVLEENGEIMQDQLAGIFADNYLLDDYRGYGGTAHSILKAIASGKPWKEVSKNVFDGMGSMGNGAAMRSGLIGAYFYRDEVKVIEQATLAAEITHFHQEAIAGAVAVALAACICTRSGTLSVKQFFDFIVENTPESDVKYKIKKAATLSANYDIRTIVSALGNGTKLTALDTVPFALWCAAHHLYDFEAAVWTAVSGLGDRDTIAAIVGSIVVLSAGINTIPDQWIKQTENFERAVFLINYYDRRNRFF
jgi:ADP-ribosylglycohydrolase